MLGCEIRCSECKHTKMVVAALEYICGNGLTMDEKRSEVGGSIHGISGCARQNIVTRINNGTFPHSLKGHCRCERDVSPNIRELAECYKIRPPPPVNP